MVDVNQEIFNWVELGWKYQVIGKHHEASKCFTRALVYNPAHSLARNALGESRFLLRDYLKAAENFYQAAVYDFSQIDSKLILTKQVKDYDLIEQRTYNLELADHLLKKYAEKAGIALLAHQYDNPIDRSIRQLYIDHYRSKIDFYGYSKFAKIEARELQRIEKLARNLGYEFIDTKNRKRRVKTPDETSIDAMMYCLNTRRR